MKLIITFHISFTFALCNLRVVQDQIVAYRKSLFPPYLYTSVLTDNENGGILYMFFSLAINFSESLDLWRSSYAIRSLHTQIGWKAMALANALLHWGNNDHPSSRFSIVTIWLESETVWWYSQWYSIYHSGPWAQKVSFENGEVSSRTSHVQKLIITIPSPWVLTEKCESWLILPMW